MKKGPSQGLALLGMGQLALESWAVAHGQAAFRGRQIYDWIYSKGGRDINGISALPRYWRQKLSQDAINIGRSEELQRYIAADGTIKLLLRTSRDGETIETVGIPTTHRLTVCVSSQAGCPMACRFCATGKGGLQRSLSTGEILDQVLSIREALNRRPSHIVFMGMGEPLLNIEVVLETVQSLTDDFGISQRRITISTVGIPKTLPILAELALNRLGRAQFTLAVSLHAPNQKLREALIPSACIYPLNELLDDCRRYVRRTSRRISFEYILLEYVNDEPFHAEELAERVRGFQSHMNLIPYNPITEETFQCPSISRIDRFRKILERRGISVSIRASRGLDKNAACGQLRHRQSEEGVK
ncbi:Ribosomal RNA large subunit methyltransferase N (chromatophore) [Paulinella micropora]|uniref:Ribosomal RNA large subunit methyltransferase N n=1 Tax=Paulinella micropora TaxID=1928728 RepID=A0A1L5YB15_9EUKA|nr:hypothetical protein PCKR_084 [Paulinella micropora]AQX44656.1 hypothetical protein PFK_084 [Paulinella micropora]BBL85862.1 Ribosomal RNA large subunit methyltransferase N [Paulinella micropora]